MANDWPKSGSECNKRQLQLTLTVKKYKCKIVPVYIERSEKFHFKLSFFEPLAFDNKLSNKEISLKLNEILEKMILKNPDQWIWSHDRWK